MKTALELIELERAQQRSLGFDAAHDDEHDRCELIDAAICYSHSSALAAVGGCGYDDCDDHWPFEEEAWKPSEDPIKSLTKAAALLVAEIERLQRLDENHKASPEDGVRGCPEPIDLVVSVSAGGSNFAAPRPRDSLRCHHCPELPGQIHRGSGVYSLCPPCNGTGYINPENSQDHPRTSVGCIEGSPTTETP